MGGMEGGREQPDVTININTGGRPRFPAQQAINSAQPPRSPFIYTFTHTPLMNGVGVMGVKVDSSTRSRRGDNPPPTSARPLMSQKTLNCCNTETQTSWKSERSPAGAQLKRPLTSDAQEGTSGELSLQTGLIPPLLTLEFWPALLKSS